MNTKIALDIKEIKELISTDQEEIGVDDDDDNMMTGLMLIIYPYRQTRPKYYIKKKFNKYLKIILIKKKCRSVQELNLTVRERSIVW
jgi:hypothetical protein